MSFFGTPFFKRAEIWIATRSTVCNPGTLEDLRRPETIH